MLVLGWMPPFPSPCSAPPHEKQLSHGGVLCLRNGSSCSQLSGFRCMYGDPPGEETCFQNMISHELTWLLTCCAFWFMAPRRGLKSLKLSVVSCSVMSVQGPLALGEIRFLHLVTGQRWPQRELLVSALTYKDLEIVTLIFTKESWKSGTLVTFIDWSEKFQEKPPPQYMEAQPHPEPPVRSACLEQNLLEAQSGGPLSG